MSACLIHVLLARYVLTLMAHTFVAAMMDMI